MSLHRASPYKFVSNLSILRETLSSDQNFLFSQLSDSVHQTDSLPAPQDLQSPLTLFWPTNQTLLGSFPASSLAQTWRPRPWLICSATLPFHCHFHGQALAWSSLIPVSLSPNSAQAALARSGTTHALFQLTHSRHSSSALTPTPDHLLSWHSACPFLHYEGVSPAFTVTLSSSPHCHTVSATGSGRHPSSFTQFMITNLQQEPRPPQILRRAFSLHTCPIFKVTASHFSFLLKSILPLPPSLVAGRLPR